jgi:putative copper export protein
MTRKITLKERITTGYWSLVAICSGLILSLQPIMAETIFDRFSKIMKDIYGELVAISTIVAVTAAAIALLVRMISRNQRAVDEASSWLKRIIVTWIVLNTLGFAVAYLQPLIAGGNYGG